MSAERIPGQRPAWCHAAEPEEPQTEVGTGAHIVTWARYFAPQGVPWEVGLFAEDRLTADGFGAGPTRVQVFDPERDLTPDEAEQFALAIIDAAKTAQNDH